jgi:uncharacterized protein YbjT (DUF2867 family)
MRILVCGASGFLGRSLSEGLSAAGHTVVRGQRHPAGSDGIAIDYARDVDAQAWLPRLEGIDAVINAVGVIRASDAGFEALHHRAPAALFDACAKRGVRKVIQISALGAETAATPYFRTKLAADRHLERLGLDSTILRPSLVYGTDGVSAAMFRTLATLPVLPVPALGDARFQPVHVDDLVAAVLAALAQPAAPRCQVVPVVGASVVSYRDMVLAYRRAMGIGHAPLVLTLPRWLMAMTARLASLVPSVPLTPDNWRMLQLGSAGDPGPLAALLGRAPLAIGHFMSPMEAELLRHRALSTWRAPLLRVALALIWIATAIVSAFVYPRADALALLAPLGLQGGPADVALYGASALNLALGLATLVRPSRALWLAQGALVLAYTALIAIYLPAWLAHPFGPVLKNVAVLAILAVLYGEEH